MIQATPTCSVVASGVAFGGYNPILGQSLDTTGMITVTCTGNSGDTANYTITISPGDGSFSSRKMISGGKTLFYNLFIDSSRVSVWGDGTSGTSSVSDSMTLTSTSGNKSYVVYSRIFSGQPLVTARTYADSVLVTMSY
jgi:spore coat protein U-like protein